MNYTLHQLKVFLKICDLKSITKASEQLYLTQPAVSIQLKKLQDQFDIPLTEVIGRQLYITEFGLKIAQVSRRILEEASHIETTAHAHRGLLTGTISISIVSTGKYVLPYFLTDFIKEHPGINFKIDVTNKQKVLESLIKNETDFALVSVLPEDIPVNTVTLMDNHLFFVGNESFATSHKKMTPKLLNSIPLIFRENGSATRKAMENYLQKINVSASNKMELVSNEAVKQAVNAGLGCSIMPLIGLRNELKNKDLFIIPMKDLPLKTSWNLIYNRDKRLMPASVAFLEYLKASKKEVIQKHFNWVDKLK